MFRYQVVCYATLGPYAEEAEGLVASADDHDIPISISVLPAPRKGMEGWRNWNDVVCFKPRFLKTQLERFKDKDGILYTDADSRFVDQPRWKDLDGVHFAAHWFRRSKVHEEEILTGTLWLANTPTVHLFLDDWIDATPATRNTFTPEQASLKRIWPVWSKRLVWRNLDPEWVWIKDTSPMVYGKREPYIVHHQASRKHRYAEKH